MIEGEDTKPRARILLAGDNADTRDGIRRALGERWDVVAVADATLALQSAQRTIPDLIIIDATPHGLTLLFTLRADPRASTSPVILLATPATEDAAIASLQAGVDDYLVAPFSAHELQTRVNTTLTLAQVRLEFARCEQELRAQADMARGQTVHILENIADGYFTLDADWCFTYINSRAERLMGRSRAELIGKNHWREYPDSLGTVVETEFRRAMEQQITVEFENYYAPWQRWFNVKVSPAKDGGLSVFFQEISDRKQVEAQVLQTAEQLRLITDTVPALISYVDKDGYYRLNNHAYETWLGRSRADITHQPMRDVLGDAAWAKVRPHLEAAFAGQTVTYESSMSYKDDGTRWISATYTPHIDAHGAVAGVAVLVNDITERHQADQALRDSEDRFRTIVNQAMTGVVQTDATGRMTLVNRRWCEMIGYSEAELLQMTVLDVTDAISLAPTLEGISGLVESGSGFVIEKRYKRKDGTGFWATSSINALRCSEGKYLGLVAVVVDITERKLAEEDLRERNRQLDLLTQTGQQLIFSQKHGVAILQAIFDRVAATIGAELCFNYLLGDEPETLRLAASTGISAEQRDFFSVIRFGDYLCGTVAQRRELLIVENMQECDFPEASALCSAGVRAYAGFPLLAYGQLLGTVAFATKLCDKFRADELQLMQTVADQVAATLERWRLSAVLSESEVRFRTLADNMSQFAWMTDEKGWIFWYNQRWYDYTGTTLEDMQGWGWQKVHHPEHVQRVVDKISHCFATGELWDDTFPLRGKDGTYRWFLSRAVPIRDDQGKVVHWFGTNTDVTEQREAEAAARENTARLNFTLESARVGDWDLDLINDTATRSLRHDQAFGYNEAAPEWGYEKFLTHLHPDDRAEVDRKFGAALAERKDWHFESRVIWSDGGVHWIEAHGNVYRSFDDQPTRMLGIVADITERKHAAEQLVESKQRLDYALSAAGMVAWDIDLLSGKTLRSDNAEALLQLSADDTLDDFLLRVHADDRARMVEALHRTQEDKTDYQIEFRMMMSDGGVRWIADTARVVFGADGKAEHITGVMMDITARKEAEESLQLSRERMDLAVDATELGLWYCDLPFDTLNWNDKVKEHFGLPPETEVTIDTFYASLHPEDRERTREAIEQSIAEHSGYRIDYRTLCPNGRLRWIRAIGHGFYDSVGKPVRFDGITIDITEEKQTEARQRFLITLNDAMRYLQNPADIMSAAIQLAAGHFSVGHCLLAEVDAAQEQVSIKHDFSQATGSVADIHNLHDYGPEILSRLKQGETVVIDNVLPEARHPSAFDAGATRAVLIVPLMRKDRLTAIFALHHATPRGWSRPDVAFAEQIAERVWLAVERTRAEHELQQSEERLRRQLQFTAAITDSLGEGVYALDNEGRVTFVNPAAERMLGWKEEELMGREIHSLIHYKRLDGTPLPREECPLLEVLHSGGELKTHEDVFIRRDGAPFPIYYASTPIVSDGRIMGVVNAFHDITRRKQAEAQLQAFTEQLQRSNRELQEFASVASHDLQEPLRKIQTFGERLMTGYHDALPLTAQDYLARMQKAAARMQELISDLLLFSRVTSKPRPWQQVDLGQVTRAVITDLEIAIREVQGHVEMGWLPVIEAEPTQMRQLVQNLITNALKFHKPGEAPRIDVQARLMQQADAASGENYCELQVSDNGIGFEMEYAERIFGLFERLHGRGDFPGTGMGLAICRKIAERHGGTIRADSTPGQGATFIITLPVAQSHD